MHIQTLSKLCSLLTQICFFSQSCFRWIYMEWFSPCWKPLQGSGLWYSLSSTSNITVPKISVIFCLRAPPNTESSQSVLSVRECCETWKPLQTYLDAVVRERAVCWCCQQRCSNNSLTFVCVMSSACSSFMCGPKTYMLFSYTKSCGSVFNSSVCRWRHSAFLKVLVVLPCNHDFIFFIFFPNGLSVRPDCQMSEAHRHSGKQLKPFSPKALFI